MISIITSRTRAVMNRRPSGVLVPNLASRQYQGLVAWYPATPLSNLDWKNAINSQFTLTNTNSVPIGVHQEAGRTYSFTPASSHHFKLTSAVLTAVPVTLACWFVPNVTTAMGLIDLHASLGATTRDSFQILTSSAAIVANACDTGAVSGATSLTLFRAGELTHGCGVFLSATSRSAFCNGTGKATNTDSRTPTSIDRTAIGCRLNADVAATLMNGAIVDARIYNRALSDDAVYDLYDPETRWDLYYPLGRVSYFFIGASGGLFFQTVPAIAVGVSVFATQSTFKRTLDSTAVGTSAMQRMVAKFLSAVAIGVPTLTKLMQMILSAVAVGVANLLAGLFFIKNLDAVGVGVAGLAKLIIKLLEAVAVGVVGMQKFIAKTLSAVAIGVSAMAEQLSLFMTLSATAVGAAALSTAALFYKLLSAIGVGASTLATVFIPFVPGSSVIRKVIRFFKNGLWFRNQ